MSDPYTVRTSPRRELEGIEHRIRHLQRAIRDRPGGTRETLNTAELVRLQDLRAGWEAELARNRLAWIAHWTRQRRLHQALARRAISELQKLQQMEVVAGDTPSPNGSKHTN